MKKRKNEKWTFYVGADDPEMEAMIPLLESHGILVVRACVDGTRVHAGNAYDANTNHSHNPQEKIGFIECWVQGIKPDHIIDHHRPGDPGYGKGPTEYWEASSIGQLYDFLDIEIASQRTHVLAAMDHCFYEAMQGSCPGITTAEVLHWKCFEISRGPQVEESLQEVKAMVARYERQVLAFRTEHIGNACVHLVPHTGTGYTCEYLCAQVAAVKLNVAVLITMDGGEEDVERVHLCGAVSEQLAEYFLDHWAPEQGYAKIYGNPSRNYAGGYRSA